MAALRWNTRTVVLGAVLGLIVLGVFLAFGPPELFARSEEPAFCGGACHPMEANYESWFHEGPHRQVKCVDCHLPNTSTPRHLWQKGLDGVHDLWVFSTDQVPDQIELSERGQGVVQENCLLCHGDMTTHIDQERTCWDCHRSMSHGFGGSVEAKNP